MRDYLLLTLKLLLLWWIIFLINRIVFISFFADKLSGIPLTETLSAFIHGFPLDFSAICYLLVLPLLMLIVQQVITVHFYRYFLNWYITIALVLISFISVFDLAIYADWGTKLSYRAIHYLKYAQDGAAFVKFNDTLILLLLLLIQLSAGILLYRMFFRSQQFRFQWPRLPLMPAAMLIMLFGWLIAGMRGGWQQIPINESSAYFSKHQIVNDVAVNTVWNGAKKALQDDQSLYKNPYAFFTDDMAREKVKALYAVKKDSTIQFLTTARPNIVLFILESFTSDVIAALGGEQAVTPHLDTLIRHGLLFSQIYSQGFRTDQGLSGLLSGFPAQPNFSIIMQPEKFQHLSYLPEKLKSAGYHTSFFYGGEAAFANMKAYLLAAGVEDITDKNSFSADEMNAKWGAHDGFVFRKQAKEASGLQEPFFSIILSLSSHEPFEVPMETRFPGDEVAAKFKNSCAYTDLSLGEYFQSVKNESWYSNTLFIIVADHGHLQPRNRNPREPARFHIPLLFYGEVIQPEFRGKKIPGLGMQSDLPASLLAQLQLPYHAFTWSHNLMNPYRGHFAYYTSDDAFGWMTDAGSMTYDFKSNRLQNNGLSESEVLSGKAFLQALFEEYISY